MEFVSPIFDLYSDYLLVNQGQPTATRLSTLVEGKLSHDSITRSLNGQDYGSRDLWKVVKPFAGQIAQENAVLIGDDTVEEKPYMDPNNLIRYHFDHCQGRTIKGINQLTMLYHSGHHSLPVAYELIKKDQPQLHKKTGKTKWVSSVSKHYIFRQMKARCFG